MLISPTLLSSLHYTFRQGKVYMLIEIQFAAY